MIESLNIFSEEETEKLFNEIVYFEKKLGNNLEEIKIRTDIVNFIQVIIFLLLEIYN